MISVPACNKPEGGTRDEPKFGNDWHELSALYERGDALSDTAFQAWIAQLRTSAHPLVGKLQAPLDARQQARAEAMLETLPGLIGAESGPVTAASTGRRIGPYKLLRHLGSGGMAEVWLAERVDGAFQRTVAIKLLFRHAVARSAPTSHSVSHASATFLRRFIIRSSRPFTMPVSRLRESPGWRWNTSMASR